MKLHLPLFLLACSLCAAPDSMTFRNVSRTAISDYPMQFGRQFVQGEIANYPQVLIDGAPITTQANVQSRWGDGSVKYAIITFVLSGPVAKGRTATLTFRNQVGCNCGSAVHETKAGMLSEKYDFDAQITATGAATSFMTSARNMITNWDGNATGPPGPVQYWADGSIATTVIVADHSTSRQYDFGWKDKRITALSDDSVSESATTVPVFYGGDIAALSLPTVVQIEAEQIRVCSVKSNTLNVCAGGRFFNGSSRARHRAGSSVASVSQVNSLAAAPNSSYKSLRPIFHCTFWPSLGKVKIRFIVENSNTLTLQDQTYDVALTVGEALPTKVYARTSIPHKGGSRWTKTFWTHGAPTEMYDLDHNLAYLISSNAVPNYDTTKMVSQTKISNDDERWRSRPQDIYDGGEWQTQMGTAGGRADIGPYPSWTVRWLYTGDYRERQITLISADLASAWQVHQREGDASRTMDKSRTTSALGRMLSISARPTLDYSQGYLQPDTATLDKVIPVGSITSVTGSGKWGWDSSHLPEAFTIPYMLTGDFYYLEEGWLWCGYSAAYPVSDPSVNYGRGAVASSGGVYMGQERSIAWGLRERAETAAISPDGFAEKQLLNAWMDDLIAILDGEHHLADSLYNRHANWNWGYKIRRFNPLETANGVYPPLGQWWKGSPEFAQLGQAGYGIDTTLAYEGLSGFETAYLTYALGRAQELGYATGKLLHHIIAPWYTGVINDPAFNPYLLQCGRIPTTKRLDHSYYSSMGDLLTGYYATPALARAHGATVWRGISAFPLSDAENGYDFLGSAAISYLTPYSGGEAAWNWVQPRVERSKLLNDNPKWALIPRVLAAKTVAARGQAQAK